ncbi:MAG TPA: 30S ribosomal protein S17 [Candidatus Limnocylindria bacterium]|nr:30S ribosomal protein S17 [Candidatus Limnocylindria bacterium]
MAEKTTTKKTTATKATAARKTTAAKSTATRTAAKKTTAARAAAPAKPAAAVAAVTAARKTAASVRKRTAATVARGAVTAGEAATGWRRFRRKTKVGVVVSAKQPKTVIVTVGRMREHPLYKKVVRLRKRFAAHDEAGDVREGDLVRIQESRPYSATKRWRVVEVLSRAGEAGAAAPRVADIEKALEQAEGVAELIAKPASERAEESEAEA